MAKNKKPYHKMIIPHPDNFTISCDPSVFETYHPSIIEDVRMNCSIVHSQMSVMITFAAIVLMLASYVWMLFEADQLVCAKCSDAYYRTRPRRDHVIYRKRNICYPIGISVFMFAVFNALIFAILLWYWIVYHNPQLGDLLRNHMLLRTTVTAIAMFWSLVGISLWCTSSISTKSTRVVIYMICVCILTCIVFALQFVFTLMVRNVPTIVEKSHKDELIYEIPYVIHPNTQQRSFLANFVVGALFKLPWVITGLLVCAMIFG